MKKSLLKKVALVALLASTTAAAGSQVVEAGNQPTPAPKQVVCKDGRCGDQPGGGYRMMSGIRW